MDSRKEDDGMQNIIPPEKVELVRKEIIEVLKTHQIPALLAADILRITSRDIICYFNTKDIQSFYNGFEVMKRIMTESKLGNKDLRISWEEILKSGQ